MVKGIFVLDSEAYEKVYAGPISEEINRLVEIYAPPLTSDSLKRNLSILHDADVIFSGWGGPLMDEEFLSAAANLKAVFYGAGTIKYIVTEAFWEKGIVITSAYAANAIPVSEYTVSQILFCLKRGWYFALAIKRDGKYPPLENIPGAYGSTVGIISLGAIGKRVCKLLGAFDLKVIAYDPFADDEHVSQLGVELRSLDDIFRYSDVVSLHTPLLKETVGMIKGKHFAMMKPYASFINTARGAIVREDEMIEVLRERSDITAVLDVTSPEPPREDSPLYTLPNVVLTPHIAGSMGRECRRMGEYVLEELKRWLAGEPLKWQITREKAAIMA